MRASRGLCGQPFQQSRCWTFWRLATFHTRDTRPVEAEIVGHLTLRPPKSFANCFDVDLIAHAA